MDFFALLVESFPGLMAGLGLTVKITFFSLIFAVILGLISCLFQISHSKILHGISRVYIDIMRGLPVMVLAFFIYYGVFPLMNVRPGAEVGGILTLSLNAGAYISEIFRSGIQAVNPGQMEAARSLGLPYSNAMRRIILPQALRIVTPSMVNQFIITLKDTSIISVIGLVELTQSGNLIIARNFRSFETWLMVAVIYIVIITVLSRISKVLERRMQCGKG